MPEGGPRGGEHFNDAWQPVMGLLWDELDRNHWGEVAVTGPVQASKSFGALVVPTLRDIVELRYSPILGVPEADMFSDKWDRDFKPVLEASDELRWLLPTVGSGTRAGRVKDRVTFDNGTDLKVMSRGGKATNKAGYTTPRLRITEAAGFSDASKSDSDEEADSFRQLVARLGAFDLMDPRRLVLIEGTGTVADQLPWRLRGEDDDEVPISTQSRIVSPCPHCPAWISPEREHLQGWQTARNIREAYDRAVFVCPECGGEIDDELRRTAMADCRLLHRGQTIDKRGRIRGEAPPVFRLWFRYSAYHNCLLNAGTTAAAEYEAAQIDEGTEDRENAERDLCQKKWAIPYVSRLGENEPLKASLIRRRVTQLRRNILPASTKRVSVGIDIGDWTSWPVSVAHLEGGQRHVPNYGAITVKRSNDDDAESRIVASLHEYADLLEQGYPQEGTDGFWIPDKVWIDGSYKPEAVAKFIRERGGVKQNRYFLAQGRGKSTKFGGYRQPTKVGGKVIRLGKRWYLEVNYDRRILEVRFDADYWKLTLAAALRAKSGAKGSIELYAPESKNEHMRIGSHWAAEQLQKIWEPGKGLVEKWVITGDNHLLDGAAMALGAGDMAGIDLLEVPDDAVPEPAGNAKEKDGFWHRMAKLAEVPNQGGSKP